MSAVAESLLCARPMCAQAAGRWMLTFLGECREQILKEEVPEIVTTLYTCLRSSRQSTPRGFVLRAMLLLARSHQEPVLDSLLQQRLPTDRSVPSPFPLQTEPAPGRLCLPVGPETKSCVSELRD
nr:PREDICTED: maestro heat-like repeat-containing protein family member 2B [Struthio camelus australis]